MHLVLLENITRFPMKYDIHSFTYPGGLIRNNANTICYRLLSREFYTNILLVAPLAALCWSIEASYCSSVCIRSVVYRLFHKLLAV